MNDNKKPLVIKKSALNTAQERLVTMSERKKVLDLTQNVKCWIDETKETKQKQRLSDLVKWGEIR